MCNALSKKSLQIQSKKKANTCSYFNHLKIPFSVLKIKHSKCAICASYCCKLLTSRFAFLGWWYFALIIFVTHRLDLLTAKKNLLSVSQPAKILTSLSTVVQIYPPMERLFLSIPYPSPFYPSIRLSFHPSVLFHKSIRPSVRLSPYRPSIHIQSLIRLSIHPSLSTHPSIHQPVRPSICSSGCPSPYIHQ